MMTSENTYNTVPQSKKGSKEHIVVRLVLTALSWKQGRERMLLMGIPSGFIHFSGVNLAGASIENFYGIIQGIFEKRQSAFIVIHIHISD